MLNQILLSLEKIARSLGGDEDQNIFLVEDNQKIIITEEKAPTNSSNRIAIWVLESYENEKYISLKEGKIYNNNLIQKTMINRKEFLKYPIEIELSRVFNDIAEDLKEEHGIRLGDLTEEEWERIQDTEIWKKCEVQVAREIIAKGLIENLEIIK